MIEFRILEGWNDGIEEERRLLRVPSCVLRVETGEIGILEDWNDGIEDERRLLRVPSCVLRVERAEPNGSVEKTRA